MEWLKSIWSKLMINQSDIKQAANVDIAISAPMLVALRDWSLMYINRAPWLLKDDTLRTLHLPAAISAEIARAVTIEMKIKLEGQGPRAEFLAEQLAPVQEKLRRQVEYGVAKGGLMMKPYVEGDQIAVDFIQADQFYPVNFDASGKITACVFADQRTIGSNTFTRLEFHSFDNGQYTIKNQAFRAAGVSSNQYTQNVLGTKCPLTDVPAWKDLQEEATITGISKPLFGYFKNPQANNIDPASPLGVSCFSRAVDLIREADEQWSGLMWEFESSKRALYVDRDAFDKDKSGKPILPNKRLYKTLTGISDLSKDSFFEEWSPDIREQSILNGLDSILRRVEFNCGLAYGTISNPATVDKTATELKIAQQRSYATITDTQKNLGNALKDLIYAMDIWTTLNDLAPKGTYNVNFDFDDSVIVDKDAQFTQDLRLVTTNIMSKVEFRMRNFGEDEATAQSKIDDAAPAPIDMNNPGGV
jgi:A118 family predicted phage portal protein